MTSNISPIVRTLGRVRTTVATELLVIYPLKAAMVVAETTTDQVMPVGAGDGVTGTTTVVVINLFVGSFTHVSFAFSIGKIRSSGSRTHCES